MIFLLDTDLLIYMIRGLKSTTRQAAHRQRALSLVGHCRRAQLAGDEVGLSAVTVSELEFGARHSEQYEAEMAAVRKTLTPFQIYDYDAVACPVHYGRVRFELESHGQSIGSMDLMIAAHALSLDATLVTNNETHFKRVSGLNVANWLKHT